MGWSDTHSEKGGRRSARATPRVRDASADRGSSGRRARKESLLAQRLGGRCCESTVIYPSPLIVYSLAPLSLSSIFLSPPLKWTPKRAGNTPLPSRPHTTNGLPPHLRHSPTSSLAHPSCPRRSALLPAPARTTISRPRRRPAQNRGPPPGFDDGRGYAS